MSQLQVIEYSGQRVLTTAQIAEAYGTTADKINYNFNYNVSRYKVGKHYFLLVGEELRAFKEANREFQGSLNKLYLWTEKGAWFHAKSLSTDRAWEAYELLVDDYYRVKEASIDLTGLSPQLQLLIAMEHRQMQIEQRQQHTEQQITVIKETFLQRDESWRQKINGMINGVVRHTGAKYSEADPRLKEIYTTIVKELSIGTLV